MSNLLPKSISAILLGIVFLLGGVGVAEAAGEGLGPGVAVSFGNKIEASPVPEEEKLQPVAIRNNNGRALRTGIFIGSPNVPQNTILSV